ncbi:growth/differentiation factor 9 [Octodon degus]|uniref:Growth/differentiation factor 9 n=1 Tax=Octodon degus TaxID=10160 RepID=A0A6P3VA33_OCTDE|nr:growth/differentiation factor 9 [Octodon degus]
MALPRSFLLGLCCFAWLSSINPGSWASRGEAQTAASVKLEPEAAPWSVLQPVDGDHSSGLLLPLFKVLSGRQGRAPGLQPDSRALHYMKKLYKTYATKEGIPKPTGSHPYNTIRLFTPHSPKKYTSGGQVTGAFPSAELLFSLGRVAAAEHLLRSVLLYAFSSAAAAPASSAVRCACSLAVAGPESPGPLAFRSQIELGKNYRWVELDVTSLLQPLVASSQRSVRLSVNFTCLGQPRAGLRGAPLRAPPSLVLYLNDTSARAHRRQRCARGPAALGTAAPGRDAGRPAAAFADTHSEGRLRAREAGSRFAPARAWAGVWDNR